MASVSDLGGDLPGQRVQLRPRRVVRTARVELEHPVAAEPRQDVEVEVEHLLARGFSVRLPDIDAIGRQRSADGACDARDGISAAPVTSSSSKISRR
jgi:hypothetical protein